MITKKVPWKQKKQISYIPDKPEVFDKLKGITYLNFMADVYGVSAADRKERIAYYLELFQLKEAVGDVISSYSHGMKQKIALIGGLLHEPNLFILDEPMVGLDPKSAFHLKEVMRQMCQKREICVFFNPCS